MIGTFPLECLQEGLCLVVTDGGENDNWIDRVLGPLPKDAILKCLGLDLKPGSLMFYAHAQKHTFNERPERNVCIPHLEQAVATPSHIGQQPGYEADSFDLVYTCPDGLIVLVAVSM